MDHLVIMLLTFVSNGTECDDWNFIKKLSVKSQIIKEVEGMYLYTKCNEGMPVYTRAEFNGSVNIQLS